MAAKLHYDKTITATSIILSLYRDGVLVEEFAAPIEQTRVAAALAARWQSELGAGPRRTLRADGRVLVSSS